MERTIPCKTKHPLPIKRKQYYHIYKITNIVNGKCYIGSAVDIVNRWWLHIKMLKSNTHHSIKLQRAWNKYKEVNFTFEIIDSTNDKKRLIPDEQYWMDTYDSVKRGYNVSPIAGSQLGFRHSEKSKLLIGQVQKGRISNRKGVHLSEKTKEKIRQANLGKIIPEYVKEKLRKNRFKMSDAGKQKISQASGKKNYYTILLENLKTIELNYFHDYCTKNSINYKQLHAWSQRNKNNSKVHPNFKIKILNLSIK